MLMTSTVVSDLSGHKGLTVYRGSTGSTPFESTLPVLEDAQKLGVITPTSKNIWKNRYNVKTEDAMNDDSDLASVAMSSNLKLLNEQVSETN